MKSTLSILFLYMVLVLPAAGQSVSRSGSPVPSVNLISSAKVGDNLIIGGDMGIFIMLNTKGDISIQDKENDIDELRRLSLIESINENGLAVGTAGAVFKYRENTWTKLDFDYKSSLRSIYSVDESKVIITATGGKFYLSEDGGNTWTEQQTAFPYDINCAIKTGSEVLLCGSNGLFISSGDFFETYDASINNVPGNILAISQPDPAIDEYLLFTQQGQIFMCNPQDNSSELIFQDPEFTFADWAQNGDTILVTASENSILVSGDKGLNWEVIDHNFDVFIYSAEYYNGQFILNGEEGNIISYKNNEFERIIPQTNYDFHCAATFDDKIFTGTYNGLVLATEDGGLSWTKIISVPDEIITGIVSDGKLNLLFSTSGGSMYAYDIGTDSFTERETGIPGSGFQGVFFTGGNYYTTTLKGSIYRSSNGETWQLNYPTQDSTVIFDIYIDEQSGIGFAVGDRGKVIRTDDNGTTWNDTEAVVNFPLLTISHVNDRWFLAGMYGSFIYSSDAMGWETGLSDSFDGVSYTKLTVNPSDSFILATSIDGKVMITKDLANTWDTLTNAYSLLTSMVWTDDNTVYAFGHNSSVYKFNFDPVSIITQKQKAGFLIYPLPARDKMVVEILNTHIRIDQFKITDVNGRLLQSYSSSFKNRFEVNVSDLNTGVYFLILESGNSIYSQRFIVE